MKYVILDSLGSGVETPFDVGSIYEYRFIQDDAYGSDFYIIKDLSGKTIKNIRVIDFENHFEKIEQDPETKNDWNIMVDNCVIIGRGLSTNKDYHLLVNANGVRISEIMTEREHELITKVIASLTNYEEDKRIEDKIVLMELGGMTISEINTLNDNEIKMFSKFFKSKDKEKQDKIK